MYKKSLSVIVYNQHLSNQHTTSANMSVWKQPNTFLSCSTRNDVCLNRPENVPQVVSALLQDTTEIRRTISTAAGPFAAKPAGTIPSKSVGLKAGKETYTHFPEEYADEGEDDGEDDEDSEDDEEAY